MPDGCPWRWLSNDGLRTGPLRLQAQKDVVDDNAIMAEGAFPLSSSSDGDDVMAMEIRQGQ